MEGTWSELAIDGVAETARGIETLALIGLELAEEAAATRATEQTKADQDLVA